MGRITTGFPVTQVELTGDGGCSTDTRADTVIVEEPLELRVGGTAFTTTMRTPGHDIEWAHGFLYSEGLITNKDDVFSARYCAGSTVDGVNTYNVLDIDLRSATAATTVTLDAVSRNTLTTSACGVCGTASIEQLSKRLPHSFTPHPFAPAEVAALPAQLRKKQPAFRKTGGSHAAALFTAAEDGLELHAVREDVGRHNALDKLVGSLLLEEPEPRIPARDSILVMSSRASFELVQKALMAGIPGLVAVGAPTSLAVDLARTHGMFLAGFVRPDRFNLYSGELS